MLLEYVTKEQQFHGGVVNFYRLPSRAEITEARYYRYNLLVTHVTAMQSSDQAIISPRTDITPPRPQAALVSTQQECMAGCRVFHSVHSSPQSPLTSPCACRAQMLLLASSSQWLPRGDRVCPTPLFLAAQAACGLFSGLLTGNPCISVSALSSARETESPLG